MVWVWVVLQVCFRLCSCSCVRHKNEYWLLVICLLHMEQTYVGVFVDDLLVDFCLLFVGGPGFCSTSPEVSSLAAMHCGDTHVW